MYYSLTMRQVIELAVEFEDRVNQIRAITGRSEAVAKRGLVRIYRLGQHDNMWREYRYRLCMGYWGQSGRLRRLGIHV